VRKGAGPGPASGVGSLGGGVGDAVGRVIVPVGEGEGGGMDGLGGVLVLVTVLDGVAGSELSFGVRVAMGFVAVTVWISVRLAVDNLSGGSVGEGEPVQLEDNRIKEVKTIEILLFFPILPIRSRLDSHSRPDLGPIIE
jgi:hypothetical protein